MEAIASTWDLPSDEWKARCPATPGLPLRRGNTSCGCLRAESVPCAAISQRYIGPGGGLLPLGGFGKNGFVVLSPSAAAPLSWPSTSHSPRQTREKVQRSRGQIVRALLERSIKVFYVTHLFDLVQGFYREKMDAALFLRAERLADGRRTFRLVEGEPLSTSCGEDLYLRIFGAVIPWRRYFGHETGTVAARSFRQACKSFDTVAAGSRGAEAVRGLCWQTREDSIQSNANA